MVFSVLVMLTQDCPHSSVRCICLEIKLFGEVGSLHYGCSHKHFFSSVKASLHLLMLQMIRLGLDFLVRSVSGAASDA